MRAPSSNSSPSVWLLGLTVLVSGAAVMIFEITGSRVFAPYLGNSLVVWTNLIGVILASLSLGNWLGGRLGDRVQSPAVLSIILWFAAVGVAVANAAQHPVLRWVAHYPADLRWQSFIGALILFAPASVCFGMVTPYSIRCHIQSLSTSGQAVGKLSALGTVGSIAGTFAAGFFLLSYFGSASVLNGVAIGLATLSLLVSLHRWAWAKWSLVALLLLNVSLISAIREVYAEQGLIDSDTAYSRVRIYESTWVDQQPVRIMEIDRMLSSAMYLNSPDLVFEYTRLYRLAAHFSPGLRRTLLLGGAGYSYPKDFLRTHPEGSMDVVEIDPKVTELARQYFNLPNDPRLRIIHADGRTYLNRNQERYDAIFLDAFSSLYAIPFHLTTREAARQINASLTDEGVVLTNVISAVEGEKAAFLEALTATYRSEFRQVAIFPLRPESPTQPQNVLLVATNREAPLSFTSTNPEYAGYLRMRYTRELPGRPPLTDAFAPVDRYILPLIAR
jgi:spermidine synthase